MLPDSDAATLSHGVGLRRLALGLFQGLALFLMFKAVEQKVWPATNLATYQALLLPLLFAPLAAIHAISHLPRRVLAAWLGIIILVCALVGFFDGLRVGGALSQQTWEPALILFGTAVGLFIAEALVLAANTEGKRIAHYAVYFDAAWKHGIQVAAAAGFVGALWLLLFLGSRLFELIKLTFLSDLIEQAWFAIPITAMALAVAIHHTDVRHSLVRGIRTLALTLLSWLLPLLGLIVAGFLLSLPFTGLQPLWETNFAAAFVLMIAGALIILINAAYQDGLPDTRAHTALHWVMTVAAVLPAPLIAIAAYALTLRVQEYGWTAERVYALACIAVGACYGIGYIAAAVRPAHRLKTIENANVFTSFVVIGVLLALLTPIADPVRIAVGSQTARLAAGKISAEAFDYKYLRFEGGRYGAQALARMQAGEFKIAGVSERAAQAMALVEPFGAEPAEAKDLALNVTIADGREIPATFLTQDWGSAEKRDVLPGCLRQRGEKCEIFLLDLNGDAVDEIILISDSPGWLPTVFLREDEAWARAGTLPRRLACADLRARLRAGEARVLPARINDLEIGGLRMDAAGVEETDSGHC